MLFRYIFIPILSIYPRSNFFIRNHDFLKIVLSLGREPYFWRSGTDSEALRTSVALSAVALSGGASRTFHVSRAKPRIDRRGSARWYATRARGEDAKMRRSAPSSSAVPRNCLHTSASAGAAPRPPTVPPFGQSMRLKMRMRGPAHHVLGQRSYYVRCQPAATRAASARGLPPTPRLLPVSTELQLHALF